MPGKNVVGFGGFNMRNTGHYATVETERGPIVIELYPEVAPKTVENFEKLVNQGFYNNLTFHRVVPGFVVQGGDPSVRHEGAAIQWMRDPP
jgi:cyclophilin family peptidyl-prolyl cis-trans isomerase